MKSEKANRVLEILSLLKAGFPRKQIKEQLISKYNISEVTVDKDFSEATKQLNKQIDLTAEGYKVLLNNRLEDLYNKAVLKTDLKSAVSIINSQIKLNGLDVQKQEISLDDNQFQIKLN